MSEIASALEESIRSGKARVGTIGLGYVGLPLSVEFASAGLAVTGFDLTEGKVAAVNRGESYIKDVPSERLAAEVKAGRLKATTQLRRARDLRRGGDLRPHAPREDQGPGPPDGRRRGTSIASRLRPGQLVVLESTTYPGTTEELILPLLARAGPEGGRVLLPGVLARARRPGERAIPHPEHPQDHRRRDAAVHPRGPGALRTGHRHRHPRLVDPRRRDGEAAREHLPEREHRPRERSGPHVRAAQGRRLGSDRRGRQQALRLHALLPRPRARRPLHPHRPASTSPGS